MPDVSRLLRRLSPRMNSFAFGPRPSVLPVAMSLSAGVETQSDAKTYRWNGMDRSWDPKCPPYLPYIVFQYTLRNNGRYDDARGNARVGEGEAFTAVVPSAHKYYLGDGDPPWSFFWIAVAHPHAVERMIRRVKDQGAVISAEPDSALVGSALSIIESLFERKYADEFALEGALWDFVEEFERHYERLQRPPNVKERLLEQVSSYLLPRLDKPIGVDEVAKKFGMHRVSFSTMFKRATGFSPAEFILHLRLDEARRQLRTSKATLQEIAGEVGLGSANHLCRVFRAAYNMTPGQFRGEP